jgi:hypothetical protein
MKHHPLYHFSLFLITFVAILGGVFSVFKLLGAVGSASVTSNSLQTANIAASANNVESSSFDPAELAIMSTVDNQTASTTATSSVQQIQQQPQPQPRTNPRPKQPIQKNLGGTKIISAGFSNNISQQLGSFELSLADAVRSISTPQQTTAQSVSVQPAPAPVIATSSTVIPIATTTTVTADLSSSTPSTTPDVALPYVVNNFSTMMGWQGEWGDVSIESSSLAIGATPSSTGGEALLLNSDTWTNYLAKVVVDWQSGQTFSLIARYNPGMDNVSCEFLSSGEISIYRTINGQRTLIGMGTVGGFSPDMPVNASIQVKDDRVECGLNGGIVKDYMYSGMPAVLLSGGFDIETWDPTPGKAQILIQSVDVEPAY